jgi:hypothetical protein
MAYAFNQLANGEEGGPVGSDRNYDPDGRGYHRYELESEGACYVYVEAGCTLPFFTLLPGDAAPQA